MTNAIVSRPGQINAAGDTNALFLKLFSGEVLTAFEINTVFLDKHVVQPISGGISKQFPVLGRNTASYHTPGTEILGNTIQHNERVITLDDFLISPVFVADWDQLVNHYEIRSEYSKQCGLALAYQFDRQIAQVGILSARASALMTDEPGGSTLTDANYATSGAALAAGAFDAAQALDEKNISMDGRNLFVRPAQYYLMAETTSILNKDWGGSGSYREGKVPGVAGLDLVKTNQLPSTNVNTGPSKYQGNFSTTVGLVMQRYAVGTVKAADISVRADYDPRRLGTLMVGKLAVGSGILRPACAIELKTS